MPKAAFSAVLYPRVVFGNFLKTVLLDYAGIFLSLIRYPACIFTTESRRVNLLTADTEIDRNAEHALANGAKQRFNNYIRLVFPHRKIVW